MLPRFRATFLRRAFCLPSGALSVSQFPRDLRRFPIVGEHDDRLIFLKAFLEHRGEFPVSLFTLLMVDGRGEGRADENPGFRLAEIW